MSNEFTYVEDIAKEVEIPTDGILSRTLLATDALRAVLFAFSPGQELTEHTSSMEAVMHFLSGDADITVGDEDRTAGPGTWVRMAPKVKHSIRAKSPVQMLLLLVKKD